MSADAAASEPLRWQNATIERVVAQTPRVVSLFLQTSIARHDAGQHVDVRLTAPDGYQAQRSYSIASAPNAQSLELAVERLDDGEVSPYFHDVAQPGDTFEIRGPIGGHFVWRHEDEGPLLLIGGGSGVVPLMAMIRYRSASAEETPALLIYSARTWDDIIFRDELLDADAGDSRLHVRLAITRGPSHRIGDYQRRLDRTLLREILTTWKHDPRHVYVCGSNRFVESVTAALVLDSIPADRIRTERFGGA